MRGLSPTINDGQPFTADTIEIILDLPFPPSANRLWRSTRFSSRPYRSQEYISWMEEADMVVMAAKTYPRRKITGPFEVGILLSDVGLRRSDGDNRIKALLDWCESRDVIRNDGDCRGGSWEWVESSKAPKGCRVTLRSLTLRSLHDAR
jgi:Holliday junction resolvase RusA-like endonuclease